MELIDLDAAVTASLNSNIKPTDKNVKDRIKTIKKYQKQLKKLITIPVIVQKSPEWHKARETMISASDFAQALNDGKFGTQKQLIIKKCGPAEEFKTNLFFQWGNLFEQVACDIYCKMYNHKMFEFGLIKHPTLDYFGASPDGISELGIMLEIKCPMKRKIAMGDEVPLQYYYQIQGQLEVCNLEECDYFECEFQLYNNYNEFLNDNESIRGIILKKNSQNIYSEVIMKDAKHQIDEWIKENEPYDEMQCWMLKTYNIQRVKKNTEFLEEKLKGLKEIWDKICFYKQNPEVFQKEFFTPTPSISIETEPFHPIITLQNNKQVKLSGYLFLD